MYKIKKKKAIYQKEKRKFSLKPAEHGVQSLNPSVKVCVPTGHFSHSELCALFENVPAEHFKTEELPRGQ